MKLIIPLCPYCPRMYVMAKMDRRGTLINSNICHGCRRRSPFDNRLVTIFWKDRTKSQSLLYFVWVMQYSSAFRAKTIRKAYISIKMLIQPMARS